MTATLEIETLRKSYPSPQGPVEVLRGVDLVLQPGESLALTGESGSGKSTLLHVAAALEAPDGGDVRVLGQSLAPLDDARLAAVRRDRIGMVFQQFNLVPSLDVADNLAFQARLAGREDPAWTAELVERLGLGGLEGRWPEQLSGGQQQRVALGRALAHRPPLLLADEPTGALDEAASNEVMALIRGLAADTGCALLIVTHSARLAAMLDRTARLHLGRLE